MAFQRNTIAPIGGGRRGLIGGCAYPMDGIVGLEKSLLKHDCTSPTPAKNEGRAKKRK